MKLTVTIEDERGIATAELDNAEKDGDAAIRACLDAIRYNNQRLSEGKKPSLERQYKTPGDVYFIGSWREKPCEQS